MWADPGTRTATSAAVGKVKKLGLRTDGFRAVTPAAVQRAALQIDGHADARTIVDRKGIDIEYQSLNVLGSAREAHEPASWRRM
jgi:hypothetical protein